MKKILEKYNKIFFALLALVLLYPTFQKGYVFLLDWHVYPNLHLSDIGWTTDPIVLMLYDLLAIIFSFQFLQRVLLFAIIFFLGTAGFRLAEKTKNIFAQYFAGLLLIINPYTYEHLIEQPGIVLGGLFFIWFLIYFLEYLEKKEERKKMIVSAVFAGLSVATFAHSIFFIGLSAVILLAFEYLKDKDWKSALKTFGIIFGMIFILNANWILGYFGGVASRFNSVSSFNSADWEAFQTVPLDNHSIYLTVLSLQGYWGEGQDRFALITDNPLWMIAFLLIFTLAAFGLWKRWEKDELAKPLAVLFFISLVLAIGIASGITAPISILLYRYVPMYIGLREPQKWVVVMLFVYAYFAAWGVKHLLEMKRVKGFRMELGIFAVILPVIFSFTMISSVHENLTPHEFPAGWADAKAKLDSDSGKGRALFFPWHSYLNFSFAGKNIVNPAKAYFGPRVIQGNNTEIGSVYSHSADPETRTIEKYVARKDNPAEKIDYSGFIADMKSLGIEEVILAKAEDWKKYSWLNGLGLKKVLENEDLIIYDTNK